MNEMTKCVHKRWGNFKKSKIEKWLVCGYRHFVSRKQMRRRVDGIVGRCHFTSKNEQTSAEKRNYQHQKDITCMLFAIHAAITEKQKFVLTVSLNFENYNLLLVFHIIQSTISSYTLTDNPHVVITIPFNSI